RQPFLPDLSDPRGVPVQSPMVAGDAEVGIVAPHLHSLMSLLLGDRQGPVLPAPIADRRKRAGATLLSRYMPHQPLAPPRLSPNMAASRPVELHHQPLSVSRVLDPRVFTTPGFKSLDFGVCPN